MNGRQNRDGLSSSEIHAAICPAMDVAELDLLLQGLGCNSVIEMMENGGKYEYWAKEPDEPVASEIVTESEPGQLSVDEQQFLDVLAAYRLQDGQPDWMWGEGLVRAIGWEGVYNAFSIIHGLLRAGAYFIRVPSWRTPRGCGVLSDFRSRAARRSAGGRGRGIPVRCSHGPGTVPGTGIHTRPTPDGGRTCCSF